MKPRLLPILLAALLTSCHEKPAPSPEMLRLHVTSTQVFNGTDPVPEIAWKLSDWLAPQIERKTIHPDVRVDFDYDVTAGRMLAMLNAVWHAGAYGPHGHLAFNMDGRMEADIPLFHPPEEMMCCDDETTDSTDYWGNFTITTNPRSSFVDFELTINAGDFSSEETLLSMDDLRELLRARRRLGQMRVMLGADTSGTTTDLLPALLLCVNLGAQVNFGVGMPYDEDENSPDWRKQYRRTFWRPFQPVFPKHPLDKFFRAASPASWPTPPPMLPASIQLTATGSASDTFLNPRASNQTTPFPFADAPP